MALQNFITGGGTSHNCTVTDNSQGGVSGTQAGSCAETYDEDWGTSLRITGTASCGSSSCDFEYDFTIVTKHEFAASTVKQIKFRQRAYTSYDNYSSAPSASMSWKVEYKTTTAGWTTLWSASSGSRGTLDSGQQVKTGKWVAVTGFRTTVTAVVSADHDIAAQAHIYEIQAWGDIKKGYSGIIGTT